jgi:hypothetical protein
MMDSQQEEWVVALKLISFRTEIYKFLSKVLLAIRKISLANMQLLAKMRSDLPLGTKTHLKIKVLSCLKSLISTHYKKTKIRLMILMLR